VGGPAMATWWEWGEGGGPASSHGGGGPRPATRTRPRRARRRGCARCETGEGGEKVTCGPRGHSVEFETNQVNQFKHAQIYFK
jgi:hypothetical protein